MIVSLAFSNFFSFAQKTMLSFELGRKPASSLYDVELPDQRRLNKVVAVVGPNGSGKTQLIKPLVFLSWFISDSFLGAEPEARIPFRPHRLLPEGASEFELVFRIEEEEYKYVLLVDGDRVVHEALYKKTTSYFSYIFMREAVGSSGEGYTYKQQGFPFKKAQAQNIRSNASLISAAHSYDVPAAKLFVDYFTSYSHNVNVFGRRHFHNADVLDSAEFFHKNPNYLGKMEKMLCEFDLGVSAVTITEIEKGKGLAESEEKWYLPFARHTTSSGETFELPFMEESSGTQSAFVLLHRILPVLQSGGVAVIDELDNDLHPHLLPKIIDLFRFENSNPKDAQLIFTCHTPEVLNVLNKHQVYLVEKHDLVSEAWRLDEIVGLRADDNLYAKYSAGALGAVPDV